MASARHGHIPSSRKHLRHPARLVPLSFAIAVAVGTLLLMLPVARTGPGRADFVTALFTATSAACVTGLPVVDTPTYWTPFGQGVILLLIQVGGFGIMTGATPLGFLVSRRLGLHTRLVAQAETRVLPMGDIAPALRLILVVTFAVETLVWIALNPLGLPPISVPASERRSPARDGCRTRTVGPSGRDGAGDGSTAQA